VRSSIAVTLVAACGGDPTGASSVASIAIEPATLVIQTNESCQRFANLFDASGTVVTGPKATWATSAAEILTISRGGKVSGVRAGSATVTATVHGHSGTLAVTVIPRIFREALVPSARTIAPGSTTQLSLVLYDVTDNVINATVPTLWQVDNPSLATVDTNGLLTSRSIGVVIVTARFATGGSLAVSNASTAIFIVAPAP
jgi:uncharacterized protein YjdB